MAQRYDVIQTMSVLTAVFVRVDVPTDGNDVMNVRISADVVAIRIADTASIVVPFQSQLSDLVPPLSVGGVSTTLPVRMTSAGERLGKPRPPALLTTDGIVTQFTGPPFDVRATDRTGDSPFTAGPLWVVAPVRRRCRLPGLGLDACRTVETTLLGRVVLEVGTAEPTRRTVSPTLIVRVVRPFEGDSFIPAGGATVLHFVRCMKSRPTVVALSVR